MWDSVFGDQKREKEEEEEEEVEEDKEHLSLTEYWASLQVFYTHSIYNLIQIINQQSRFCYHLNLHIKKSRHWEVKWLS